ncbi:MAG: C40 family peptidase [Candidatus Marinimicrobia bacterium]|nr:C40 family peptidase [Candidatus Neomarinimicrobiota bacterium]MCF7923224.1 C40 family peptidase [Candidatus Neomarinimicrobiota bacterium]
MRRKYFHGSIIVLAILLSACSSQKVGVYDDLNKSKMEKSVDKYMGTPYKWGGTEPGRGVDCSGLVSGVYRDQGIIIPRTSRSQYAVGDEVSREELQYGDLLFFDTLGKGVTHVGLYTGGNKMIHASTSAGVTEVPMNTDYWMKRYIGARRLTGSDLRSGEVGGEFHLLPKAYPIRIRRLIDVPTADIIQNRFIGLDIQNDAMGNLRVAGSVSIWNRWEFGAEIQVNQILGYDLDAFGLEWPFINTKFRIWEQKGKILPSLAIGAESNSRKWTVTKDTNSVEIVENRWSPPRNAYVVASYKYERFKKLHLGRGRLSGGLAVTDLYAYHDTSAYTDGKEDFFLFLGVEQQITRRLMTTMEFDHVFLKDVGITWNMGFQFALNNSSSIAYTWRNVGAKERSLERAMQFSYILDY